MKRMCEEQNAGGFNGEARGFRKGNRVSKNSTGKIGLFQEEQQCYLSI